MKEIPLTRGKVALVDDADFDWLNQWKWHTTSSSKDIWYACRWEYHPKPDKNRLIFMHRLILNTPRDMIVDHKDRDGLNNQRDNIRNCTDSQNTRNQTRKIGTKSSKYKGVLWSHETQQWVARITTDEGRIFLGRYDSEIDAARAYDVAALKSHGEFAKLNLPDMASLPPPVHISRAGKDKTHCPHGHPYSPENTLVSSGRRHCRICIRQRDKLRRQRANPFPHIQQQKQSGCTSIFKGVSFRKDIKCWHSQIVSKRKCTSLGIFKSKPVLDGAIPYDAGEIEAALTYDAAAIERYGQDALLNFIQV